jgi:hypothetical protein
VSHCQFVRINSYVIISFSSFDSIVIHIEKSIVVHIDKSSAVDHRVINRKFIAESDE